MRILLAEDDQELNRSLTFAPEAEGWPPVLSDDNRLCIADIQLTPGKALLSGPAGECSLSKRETALLEILVNNRNQTLHRSTLLLKVWGPDSDVADGNLENYIYFLRKCLRIVKSTLTIKTVRGIGYCLKE